MKKLVYIVFVFFAICSCVEPFTAETQVFEAALVIEARLTDEEKKHEVLLERARSFEQDSSSVERNATVILTDDSGMAFDFEEVEPGRYLSRQAFAALSNKSYQLSVLTQDGKSYISESVSTPEKVAIGNLYIEKGSNDFAEDGLKILLDNESSGADPNYFKYEYEETYKIVAPSWNPFEFDIIDSIPCEQPNIGYEVGIKPRVKQNRICYNSINSTDVLQTSTAELNTNKITGYQVRFLKQDDFKISHRYSILVKQHSQTLEAYSYYQNLDAFSSSDNVFSEIQPGFLEGNITSTADDNEKVIGYFEVTSVSTQRIFFNYVDLFPDAVLPPYPINCNNVGNPPLYKLGFHCDSQTQTCDGSCQSPLISSIQAGLVVFHSENEVFDNLTIGQYQTKPPACGDCTKLGSNVVPDFWIE